MRAARSFVRSLTGMAVPVFAAFLVLRGPQWIALKRVEGATDGARAALAAGDPASALELLCLDDPDATRHAPLELRSVRNDLASRALALLCAGNRGLANASGTTIGARAAAPRLLETRSDSIPLPLDLPSVLQHARVVLWVRVSAPDLPDAERSATRLTPRLVPAGALRATIPVPVVAIDRPVMIDVDASARTPGGIEVRFPFVHVPAIRHAPPPPPARDLPQSKPQPPPDTTPPTVLVMVGAFTNGDVIAPGQPPHTLEPETLVLVRVSDDRPIDPSQVDIASDSGPPELSTTTNEGALERAYRFSRPGVGEIRIRARDQAGNLAAPEPYRFVVVEPFAITSFRINGRDFPDPSGQFLTNVSRLEVKVATSGPLPKGRIAFGIQSSGRIVGEWPLLMAPGGTWAVTCDVGPEAGAQFESAAYVAAGNTIPERGLLIIDRAGPTVTVKDLVPRRDARGADVYPVAPGERIVLEARDPFGVEPGTQVVEGAAVVSADDVGALYVIVIDPNPGSAAPVRVRIRDRAGNWTDSAFTFVPAQPLPDTRGGGPTDSRPKGSGGR